jgi:hypothetical protein
MNFQKGDTVTAFGNTGTVKLVGVNGFIEVTFPDCPNGTVVFCSDGKLFRWAKEVSLVKLDKILE